MRNLFKKGPSVKHTTNTNPNYNIITFEQPQSIAAESYRRIKVGLEYAEVDKKIQVIQVCSSVQGEGKTITSLNVAATYAEDNKKVVCIDLDFRRPKLHRVVRIENKNGITDYLAGNISKEECIKHGPHGLDIINRGTKAPYPTAILGSKNLAAFIDELRKEYDIIILDCPPILAVSDALIISKVADGALFIVSQKNTEKNAAKEAVATMKKNNVNVLGVVFTGISKKGSNYYSSKYKYYYQNYYDKDSVTATSTDNKEQK